MKRIRKILLFLSLLSLVLLAISANWLVTLYTRVDEGLRNNRFLQIAQFHSAPVQFRVDEIWSQSEVIAKLKSLSYRERNSDDVLLPGDFQWVPGSECLTQWAEEQLSEDLLEPACLRWKTTKNFDPEVGSEMEYGLLFGVNGRLLRVGKLAGGQGSSRAFLESEIIAQQLEGNPLMMRWTSLGEIPPQCLNAVLAIEDAGFLEHLGISPEALLRALYKNVLKGQSAQGGSTITQQLVKNYFLTPEKTLKRKLTEFFMALILEQVATKDQILETYLNIIYLGQSGAFQIRGFSSAADHYFGKSLSDLNASECALLAAVLNSPGLFDPFRHPDRALQRRDRVLKRMQELGHLSAEETSQSLAETLPRTRPAEISQTAPYFIEAVVKEMEAQGLEVGGNQIYTTLIPEQQSLAQNSLNAHLSLLEAENPKLKKLKEKNRTLEGVLLSLENDTGWITAAVGGRNFRNSQFNRITASRRQIGSLIKPFVYLAAFIHIPNLNPLSTVLDEPFQHRFEGRIWSPENYDKKYQGDIPLYYAFKKSLNVPAASLGLKAGLDRISEVARLSGVDSEIPLLPSLTLGAVELTPLEVLKAYATLARFGLPVQARMLRAVVTGDGKILSNIPLAEDAGLSPNQRSWLYPGESAQVVSMMRETNRSGTAAAVKFAKLVTETAGKTGTTSDSKDAWYAGFSPDRTTLVWVGYDMNENHGLTGSNGALPVWISFMKEVTQHDAHRQFHWPPEVELVNVQNLDESEEAEIAIPK